MPAPHSNPKVQATPLSGCSETLVGTSDVPGEAVVATRSSCANPVIKQTGVEQGPQKPPSKAQHRSSASDASRPSSEMPQPRTAPSVQATPSYARAGLAPLRTGLRSGSDAVANADKAINSGDDTRGQEVSMKGAKADSQVHEVLSPSSRGLGRGRGFGRAGRRGRGRSSLQPHASPEPAGQALAT